MRFGRFCAAGALLCFVAASSPAIAQDAPLEALPEEVIAEFDQALAEIAENRADVAMLDARTTGSDGIMADVMAARRDLLWTAMVQNTVNLARGVAAQRDLNRDVSDYWDPMVEELSSLPDQIRDAIERLERRALIPGGDLELQEFVIADQELFADIRQQHELFRAIVSYVGAADDFGLDASAERGFIVAELDDHAANTSGFLLVAQNDLDTLQSAAVTLPGDADIEAWISVTRARITMTADALQSIVNLMSALDLETRIYRQQLLTATGEITADVLDVGIVGSLLADWSAAASQTIASKGPGLLFRGLLIALILYVFWQLGKLVHAGVDRALNSSRVNVSTLLRKMVVSTARNVI
jgi:small conductance mechanosensitive channel